MTAKRDKYRNEIVQQLYFAHSLSCAELSRLIDKSLPLTTRLLNELIVDGLVVEQGFAPSSGGRRPLMYSLKPGMHYLVSVALDQFVARIVVMDMQNLFVSEVEKFDLALMDDENAIGTLTSHISDVITKSKISKEKILGIGIGMPGFIDSKKGVNYTIPYTQEQSITDFISERTGLPVYLDNDSSLIALAELRFGAARGKKDVMVINIGWGVGCGLILNGELFRGHNGFAGEFSHIPLFMNGKLCSCGKSGCLETEASMLVIVEKAREGLKAGKLSAVKLEELDVLEKAHESLIRAVHGGDRFTVGLFSEAGYNIGRGVAILIHLLNPETIILSGRGSAAGRIWQAPIQHALNEHCIPRLAEGTTTEISRLGYKAELIGAAALIMESIGDTGVESNGVEDVHPDYLSSL
jgi:predicted NBD/HSP70 family sugar kinase